MSSDNLRLEVFNKVYRHDLTVVQNQALVLAYEEFIKQGVDKSKEREIASDKKAISKNGGKSN